MKKYTQEELNKILELHKKWLNNEEDGVRANLSSADLSYADLSYADLSSADLSSADLSYADLSSADLSYANLSYADLSSADLSYANLSYIIGNLMNLRSMQIEKYMVSYTDTILNIGCQSHTIQEWKNFNNDVISKMDSGALDWWTKWKPIIMHIIEMSPAEPTK